MEQKTHVCIYLDEATKNKELLVFLFADIKYLYSHKGQVHL